MGLFSKGGFLNKLWKQGTEAVTTTFETSVKTNFLSSLKNSINSLNSATLGITNLFSGTNYQDMYYDWESNRSFTSNYTKNTRNNNFATYDANLQNKGLLSGNQLEVVYNDTPYIQGDKEIDELKSKVYIPEYGYDMFLNERTIFQKGLHNFFGAPSYFYFKIFFKFDTQHGLFGGLLNNEDRGVNGYNCASGYLASIGNSDVASQRFLVQDRFRALVKFANTLSYINCTSPWFFKGVKGLDKANIPQTEEDYSKDKTISIECNLESIDMRLNTLFDLYKFACYDDVTNKEIIPDNLRKFDMCVMVFQSPIKKLHSALKQNNSVILGMPNTDINKDNFMGFKLFEFLGCEFDVSSLSSLIPSDMNNEKPFEMGKGLINIKYNKCVRLNSNEFNGILFGDYGMFYEYDNAAKSKLKIYDNIVGRTPKRLLSITNRDIIDFNEAYTVNNVTKMSRFTLGNIYGESNAYNYYKDSETTENMKTNLTPMGKYAIAKAANERTLLQQLTGTGLNYISKWLGLGANSSNTFIGGEAGGYAMTVVGGPVWKEQMNKLSSQFKHIYTKMPNVPELLKNENSYGPSTLARGYEYMNRALRPGNYNLADLAEIQSKKLSNNSVSKAYSKSNNYNEKTDIYESLYNQFGNGNIHKYTSKPQS